MAWPSIGSESFIFLTGRVQRPGEALEEITRYGEDGHEYRQIGKRAKVTQHRTEVDVTSAANAQTKEVNYHALKGTLVTVTYPDARSVSSVAVIDVEVLSIRTTEGAVGGVNGGDVIVTAQWMLQGTE